MSRDKTIDGRFSAVAILTKRGKGEKEEREREREREKLAAEYNSGTFCNTYAGARKGPRKALRVESFYIGSAIKVAAAKVSRTVVPLCLSPLHGDTRDTRECSCTLRTTEKGTGKAHILARACGSLEHRCVFSTTRPDARARCCRCCYCSDWRASYISYRPSATIIITTTNVRLQVSTSAPTRSSSAPTESAYREPGTATARMTVTMALTRIRLSAVSTCRYVLFFFSFLLRILRLLFLLLSCSMERFHFLSVS